MTTAAPKPRRTKTVRFSPVLLAVALTPVFLQTSTISCKSGDTTLSELAVIVDGEDQVDGFDPAVRSYSILLPPGTDEALVHAMSTDPNAQVWIDVIADDVRQRYLHGGVGGGDMVVSLPAGRSTIQVWVRAPKGASGVYEVAVETASAFPCTELGILDAIAAGGGPHTFDCGGPATVVTRAEIVIDNDVVLDGEGLLTMQGTGYANSEDEGNGIEVDPHRLFSVPPDVNAEIHGMTLTGGRSSIGYVPGNLYHGGAIFNEGALGIYDSVVAGNRSGPAGRGGGVHSSGALMVVNSVVSDNYSPSPSIHTNAGGPGGGISNLNGTLLLIKSVVTRNGGRNGGGIASEGGTLTLIDTTVSNNYPGGGIHSAGETTLINSTVSFDTLGHYAPGTLTLFNSTIERGSVTHDAAMRAKNSLFVGPWVCGGSGTVVSSGYNIESPGNTCGLTDPTDLVNVTEAELNLAPLADYGGPTETHALLPGSVAIDRIPQAMCVDADGQSLTTDQRGIARPQGATCDVGSFEWVDCAGTSCDDGNDCTVDNCNPLDDAWCSHTTLPDGTSCDFGGYDGVCDTGVCRDGSWGIPQLIGVADTCQTQNVDLVVDANGNVTALWVDSEATEFFLRSNHYTAGVGWGTHELIASSSGLSDAAMTVGPSGTVTAVWSMSDGVRYNIWASRYTPSVGWTTAELIETNDAGDAFGLALAVDPDDNVTAVWAQPDGTGKGIWSNRYTQNGGWGVAQLIATDGGASDSWDLRQPQVAVDPDGNATAVWLQEVWTSGGSTRIDVWGNRYTPSGGWGTAELIEDNEGTGTYTDSVQESVALVVSHDGDAVAVWSHRGILGDNIKRNVWANRYTTDGGWGIAERIETQLSNKGSVALAIDPNGNATAVWQKGSHTQVRTIWANRYTVGSGWGVAERLDTYDGFDPGRGGYTPEVVVDGNGNATVVWSERRDTTDLWWNRFTPSGGWGTAELIENNAAFSSQVAVDANGNVTTMWSEDTSGGCGRVFANRFE